MKNENFIQFKDITKTFPGVKALSDISFSIKKGEIHSLCGENGAGKSTLINLCGGVFQPDNGTILINGEEKKILSPSISKELKIAIVYQEVPLCKNLSVAANIFLGSDAKTKNGVLDWKLMNSETKKLLDMFNLDFEPTKLVKDLTLAEQSLVQIAKQIYKEPEFLILDEPTSSLSNNQKDILFTILKKIRKERGTTILYVSHRLEEVFEICDTITVFKDGTYVDTVKTSDINPDKLINMMVGRNITETAYDGSKKVGDTVLEVKNFSNHKTFDGINLALKKGEIIGLSGFQGAGRTEFARALFGLDPKDTGETFINGKKVNIKDPVTAIKNGIGMISENRRDEGIVPLMSVKDNIIMVSLKKISDNNILNRKKIGDLVKKYVKMLNIKISNSGQAIQNLSGGNQQKAIIARWLAEDPKILICDEPTRGIDVGAKAEIHSLLVELAKNGISIIMISSELPELLSVCDRIIVMYEGRITGEIKHDEATEERIMKLASNA